MNFQKSFFQDNRFVFVALTVLVIITLFTNYYGSADINDYANTAKFFAGDYKADIRNSHSYMLGFIHSPFVDLTDSFIFFKISSILFLFAIIYSIYIISNKNRKILWITILSPVIWYMAPWINPIQLSSLFLLWAYYFIEKYQKEEKIKNLLYSGILLGLGWAVWDTIVYFAVILGLCYLIDKKLSHSVWFGMSIIVGLSPRLVLDQALFNFAFFSTIKTFVSGFVNLLFGGVYGGIGHTPKTLISFILICSCIPLTFWKLYKKEVFGENKRQVIFLTLSILLILTNPQIRYMLALVPIMIILSSKYLSRKNFERQIVFSLIVLIVFIFPYILQMGAYNSQNIDGVEITSILSGNSDLNRSAEKYQDILNEDLEKIVEKYGEKRIVIGNSPDDYSILARAYWGEEIDEFVSIQDYELNSKDEATIFQKKFSSESNINNRRKIWISGGIDRNDKDLTDFDKINIAIGLNEPIKLEGFEFIESYNLLYVSKKA